MLGSEPTRSGSSAAKPATVRRTEPIRDIGSGIMSAGLAGAASEPNITMGHRPSPSR